MDKDKSKKLLVVEDEIITAITESTMLKNRGYEVQAVSTGEQAVDAVKSNEKYDLILIDLNLGSGMNGAETAERILEIKNLPVVFITAYTDKSSFDQIKSIKNYGFIIKGSGEYILLSTIEMAIELFQTRKRAEIAETTFRQLTESMNEIFWITDINRKSVIYLSPSYEKIFGRSCQSFPGSFLEIIHPDDRERFVKMHKNKKVEPLPFEYEYRIVRDDGEIRWLRSRITPVFDENGKFFRYVGIAEDITLNKHAVNELQKKNSELETLNDEISATLKKLEVANQNLVAMNNSLIESEEKLRNLTESSPLAIMIYQDDYFVYTNSVGVELTGFSKEELYRLQFWEIVDTEYQPLVREMLSKRQQNENYNMSYELTIAAKGGVKKWVSLKGNMIIYNGKQAMMISVVDITAKKIAENELIETNRQLQNALDQAREYAVAAEAANITKSQFLANMSHEIRTPMNGIIGIISLLLNTELSDEQKKFVEIMQSSGDNLLTIINQILDLSKIESQKFELDVHDFNLQVAMYDIIEMLAVKAVKKDLVFNFKIGEDVPCSLRGDSGRLRQVVLNLSYNAIKFTEKGNVNVDVKVVDESEKDVKLKFEISDTGIGIPEDHLKDLFVPFMQVDGGMSRKYGGTGLGLAISKKIIDVMGGEIGVKRNEDNGSLFWFTVVLEKQNRLQFPAKETVNKECVSIKKGTAKILLVEDNMTNRFVAKSMLKKMGHEADPVLTGFDCINALREKDYNMVFMDCQMPDMDGFETTIKIRNGDAGIQNKDIIIIAFTAHAMDGDREKCINSGMNDYIAKPIKMKELDALLKRWLNP